MGDDNEFVNVCSSEWVAESAAAVSDHVERESGFRNSEAICLRMQIYVNDWGFAFRRLMV